MKTVTEKIVSCAWETKYEQIPKSVVEKVKGHMLDALGVGLAASELDFSQSIVETATRLGYGQSQSTIFGHGNKVMSPYAALANGTFIHGIEFDDTHIEGVVHASAPIVATAMAIGERSSKNGRELIRAITCGLEFTVRLGVVVQGRLNPKGFHQTGIFGTFGACLTAGLLMDLTKEQMVNALGLCGSMAGGIMQYAGSWLKKMHPGWAAHNGIIACELALDGFQGPTNVLEGERGLFMTHLGEIPTSLFSLTDQWGSQWGAGDISIKRYPTCHFTHAFIDCAKDIRETEKINLSNIEKIICKISEPLVAEVFEPRDVRVSPKIVNDALFSVPYCVGAMFVTGKVDMSTFYDRELSDSEIIKISSLVYAEVDEKSTYPLHYPGELTVYMKDGTEYNRRIEILHGEKENPLSLDEIKVKFRNNALRVMDELQVENVINSVTNIEENQIDKFVNLLTKQ